MGATVVLTIVQRVNNEELERLKLGGRTIHMVYCHPKIARTIGRYTISGFPNNRRR